MKRRTRNHGRNDNYKKNKESTGNYRVTRSRTKHWFDLYVYKYLIYFKI